MKKGWFRGQNAAIRAISGGQIAGYFHPAHTTFQAIKTGPPAPEFTSINGFFSPFQQRLRTKYPMKDPSNEALRTAFSAMKQLQIATKAQRRAQPFSPYSSRPGDGQGRLPRSRRGSDFTLDDPQPTSTLTTKRQWQKPAISASLSPRKRRTLFVHTPANGLRV